MRQGSRLSFSSKPGHPMRRRLLFKASPAWREVCAASLISGFSPLQRQDYQTIIRFEQQHYAQAPRNVADEIIAARK
jgi:hypothetical protein